MDSAQLRTRMAEIISAESTAARQLAEALKNGQPVFAGHDAEAIKEAAALVQTLVEQVEQSEAARQALLAEAGCSADKAGTEAFLAQHAPDGDLLDAWAELLDLAAEAQHQNQVNAAIIESSRKQAEKAFALLRGQNPKQQTYGAHGRTQQGGGTRSLGEA